MFKDYLIEIDNTILKDIFCAASSALNNTDNIADVSIETGISEKRIEALLPIILDLANNHKPKITTEKEIEEQRKKIAKLPKEFDLHDPEKPCLYVVKGSDDTCSCSEY